MRGAVRGLAAPRNVLAPEGARNAHLHYGGSVAGGNVVGGTAFNYNLGLQAVGGTVNIFGKGFNLPAGPITASGGTLTGTLEDGTALNLSFGQIHSGEIVLYVVPEPGVIGFSGLVFVMKMLRRNLLKLPFIVGRSLPATFLVMAQLLANLNFAALPGQGSAFVPLPLSNLVGARADGSLVPDVATWAGRAVILGTAPLLDLRRGVPCLP
jgi:hypothetical protein